VRTTESTALVPLAEVVPQPRPVLALTLRVGAIHVAIVLATDGLSIVVRRAARKGFATVRHQAAEPQTYGA